MELIELRNKILESYTGTLEGKEQIMRSVEEDKAIFPFNEYELMLTTFVAKGNITYDHYLEIRSEYISRNPYLWLFEISAPRGFGEAFAQTYLLGKCNQLRPASKEWDVNYHGQYDLWLPLGKDSSYGGIRIEVKASRVCNSCEDEPLYKKALSSNTKSPFLMNFQQLKPQCCDVFVWMAVYRDVITIWVMNKQEVENHPDYSRGQHRGNSGNEGQLHITEKNIHTLEKYRLKNDNLALAIRKANKKMLIID